MHSHSHDHTHTHLREHIDHNFDPATLKRMRVVFVLNLGFAVIEIIGGLITNSMAILSDALHDFGDSLAILIAIILEKKSYQKSNFQYSYGYRRFSTLGALVSGGVLIVGSLLILIQAIPRLWNPVQPDSKGMFYFSIIGLFVNSVAAWRASRGQSLNEKIIMWHMIEDVAGWGVVLIGSITLMYFPIAQIDSILAIILTFWVLYNVQKNLKSALEIFLMAIPNEYNIEKIEKEILSVLEVKDIHHSHLWSLDGQKHIFTTHVVVSPDISAEQIDKVKKQIKKLLHNYHIIEATIEVETFGTKCDDPEHIS